ncbi:MAG: hypothetical protein ACK4IK_10325 [Bacteroidia bacterium]
MSLPDLKNIALIEKEKIADLKFPSEEVLKTKEEITQRRSDLEKATILGNAHRGKIKIIFEDSEGLKKVDTTIWATTEKNIILKQGVIIPICRIHQVRFI